MALAGILRDYGIRPSEAFTVDHVRARGYKRDQFDDTWLRYLPAHTAVPAVSPVASQSTGQAERHGQHDNHGTMRRPHPSAATSQQPAEQPARADAATHQQSRPQF
jgi:Protein of unknown function (DUF3631)